MSAQKKVINHIFFSMFAFVWNESGKRKKREKNENSSDSIEINWRDPDRKATKSWKMSWWRGEAEEKKIFLATAFNERWWWWSAAAAATLGHLLLFIQWKYFRFTTKRNHKLAAFPVPFFSSPQQIIAEFFFSFRP